MNTDGNAPHKLVSRRIEAQSCQQTPTDKNRPMITTEEFERWWNQEGSAINPTVFEDTSEHVKRVSEIAWANGHYMATVTNLKSQQWQPIETAPKDGTEILVGFDAGSVLVVHVAWWRELEEWMQDHQLWSEEDVGWWSYTRNAITQEKLCGHSTPTHWMPLPAPPMSDK